VCVWLDFEFNILVWTRFGCCFCLDGETELIFLHHPFNQKDVKKNLYENK
jgi:hypothetical protein